MGSNSEKSEIQDVLEALFPQRLDQHFFEIRQEGLRSEEKFQKMLILVFEVIVQPLVHTLFIALFF